MKPLFLIPARGGSKGVPGKNIRPLGGIPLIGHSIKSALAVAQDPADVVVSTDSEEIAAVARSLGANVPFMRPAEFATDTAGSRGVILHAADVLNAEGGSYDSVVLLQPTSPFRLEEDIRNAVSLFYNEKPDMVVAVKPARSNPYYNAFETDADGHLVISKGDGLFTRRQDAPPVWEIDGSLYVFDIEALRNAPSVAAIKCKLPFVGKNSVHVDIDTELDFKFAELILNASDSQS